MWQAVVVCSSCAEESEVLVDDLDDLEREVCPCGYGYVLLSVEGFEPVHAKRGELIELRPGKKLKLGLSWTSGLQHNIDRAVSFFQQYATIPPQLAKAPSLPSSRRSSEAPSITCTSSISSA